MIVLCLSMISKRFADYQSADSRMQQARWKNKKREEFVYALYSLMFDYAFVHAHDLIRTTWCRRIWIHALQPDRTMKQEIHLWNTALAPDASHHAWSSCACSCARHDVDGFESMLRNQTEPWSKKFICETLLWLPTHHIMRMISCARHDAHGFESMRCNQTEPWSKRFICETLLWLPAHHIMRMISCARHDAGVFLIASCTGVVGWSHCRTWRMQRCTYLWISAVFECMTHCSSYRAH